jgi:hypothetical protein
MVIHFEAGLVRESVDASGIRKQVKLQFLVITATLGHGPQDFARQHDGRLAAKFDHFFDGV